MPSRRDSTRPTIWLVDLHRRYRSRIWKFSAFSHSDTGSSAVMVDLVHPALSGGPFCTIVGISGLMKPPGTTAELGIRRYVIFRLRNDVGRNVSTVMACNGTFHLSP